MSLRGFASTKLNEPDVARSLDLLDGATRNLTDKGLLPDAFIVYSTESANFVFAGPDGTVKTKDTPAFRSLVAADIPPLDASKITTGQLVLARGGTGSDLSGTGGASQVLKQTTVGATIIVAQLACSDLSDYAEWSSFTPTRTAASGTWTAGTVVARTKKIGKIGFLECSITGSTLSAGTASIAITNVPITAAANPRMFVPIKDNGTDKIGLVTMGGGTITMYTAIGFGGWAGGATNNDVWISLMYEIT